MGASDLQQVDQAEKRHWQEIARLEPGGKAAQQPDFRRPMMDGLDPEVRRKRRRNSYDFKPAPVQMSGDGVAAIQRPVTGEMPPAPVSPPK